MSRTASSSCRGGRAGFPPSSSPQIARGGDPDQIRRDSAYLDTVEAIWQSLKRYLD